MLFINGFFFKGPVLGTMWMKRKSKSLSWTQNLTESSGKRFIHVMLCCHITNICFNLRMSFGDFLVNWDQVEVIYLFEFCLGLLYFSSHVMLVFRFVI